MAAFSYKNEKHGSWLHVLRNFAATLLVFVLGFFFFLQVFPLFWNIYLLLPREVM